MAPEQIAFLIIEILLVMGVLYISVLAITGRKRASTSYLASLLVAAVLAIFLLPIIRAIISMFYLGEAAPYFAFTALIYLVRYLLKPRSGQLIGWDHAILISLIAMVFIVIINYLVQILFGIAIIQL